MPPSESGAAALANSTSSATPLRAKPLLHFKDLGLSTQNRKIKFTSVHASENFLACGTNAGSVYLYATTAARTTADTGDARARNFPSKYHLVKMITPPSNDRVGVACLSICPMQKHLVVGTMRGVVYGLQLSDYNKIGEKVEFSHDFHNGFPITCFLWDKLGHRLFSACNAGLVCQTVLRAGMSAIFGSADTELLLKEETGIVHLDMAKSGRSDILLVSSQLRVLLLNLTSSDGSAVQIGTKVRQGSYGACFFTSYDDDSIDPAKKRENKVFSSRPGRRVWIADPQSGTVSSTIKFSLAKNPSEFLQNPGCALEEGIQPRNLTINKLSLFQFIQDAPYVPEEYRSRNSLLVSWNIGSSVLFFLDPIAVEIVEWHLDLGIIHDLKIMNESILVVLHGENPKVSMIQSCSARQFVDIYAANDIKKSVQMAIEFSMNDASLLGALRKEWLKLVGETQDAEDQKILESLDALHENAKSLEEHHLSAHEIEQSKSGIQPLQVIFKHRPQQQGNGSDPAASLTSSSASLEDKSITLATGSSLHKQVEYFDVLAPSFQSYSKSIYTPDGSTIEACMVDINELSRNQPVVRDDYRESYLEELMEEVKKFEQSRSEDNYIPGLNLKGSSRAAAKAFSTFLPNTSMLTSLMDPSSIAQSLGRAQMSSMFGEYSDENDPIVLDPDPRLLRRTYSRHITSHDATHEYSVLRIAMSSKGEADEGNLDAEVLLEAISMDIWDSNLKYTSNLPLNQQLNLPDDDTNISESNEISMGDNKKHEYAVQDHAAKRKFDVQPQDAPRRQQEFVKSKSEVIRDLTLQPPEIPNSRLQSMSSKQKGFLVDSMSPNPTRASQRALQKYIGATSSCEVKRKCMVGGHLALSPELEPVLKREVVELVAELQSAAATAEKTKKLTQRLWPAAGITRVCACLTSLYLFQGDIAQVQSTIASWLSCFDPTATPGEQSLSPVAPKPNNGVKMSPFVTGFARGEALIDGDGLPLTRGDWNLVRVMVSIYFAVCAAGHRLHVRPSDAETQFASAGRAKRYTYEMGIELDLEERFNWADDDISGDLCENTILHAPKLWTSEEAEAFVNKYGAYLNPELAAEVCNLRLFSDALNLVLDRAVSSPEMSDTCDEVVDYVAEKEIEKAIAVLKDRDSICILLHLLDVLLKKCPEETIEICVDKYPVLYPWNVERSLFGAKINWNDQESNGELFKPESVPQTSKYFRYLVRLLEEKSDKAGKDTLIVNRCLQLCFGGVKVVGKLFEEGGRNGLASWVSSIVRQPERFCFDHLKCWTLFVKNHLLEGLLELALTSLKSRETQEHNFNLDVVLLPCGHAFHDTCLEDHSCPICLEENFETLDWC
uniref:RING-type domain-containing protein n=1 Tax=Globisporangium ultimum (strain ATCC 200006 / CBS 805.95 / DAOM BR144) TaxID=431595 RepID=K3WPB5_GLOUD